MSEIIPCSLARVAREAGVAKSTASLALRGGRRVSAETVARVRAAAERLGYRADPRVGSLMVRIRMSRELHDRERLAFVWVGASKDDRRRDRFSVSSFSGARRRAEENGCALEEFFLNEEGMTAARLDRILVARGITGVIFSAPHHMLEVRVDWNWDHFAAVRIGGSDFYPTLHRVESNHYQNMWMAMDRMREMGCRRPAGVLFEQLHRRLHGMHRAAFVENHPSPSEALQLTRFGLPSSRSETLAWLEKADVDGLVFVMNPPDETLRWLRRLPRLRSLVTLDVRKRGVDGLQRNDQMIGAKAVDMVLAELHRNERGVPKHPTVLLLEGQWGD
ncbi:MAG: LacI family DNA-binding transcriptional regulator [Verrucomicrobiota bacterium]